MYRLALVPLLLLLGAAAPGDERSVMITGFDRLRVDGPFAVEVVAGSPGVTISGERAAIDKVEVTVQAGTLVLNTGLQGWNSATAKAASGARIRVSVPALRGVQTNGGQVRIAEMRGDRVDIALNGDGRIDIGRVDAQTLGVTGVGSGAIAVSGTVQQLRVRLYGTSSLDAAGLTSTDAMLVSGSTGAIVVGVRYNAQVSAMSTGAVQVIGTTSRCVVIGPAPVSCANIETRKTN